MAQGRAELIASLPDDVQQIIEASGQPDTFPRLPYLKHLVFELAGEGVLLGSSSISGYAPGTRVQGAVLTNWLQREAVSDRQLAPMYAANGDLRFLRQSRLRGLPGVQIIHPAAIRRLPPRIQSPQLRHMLTLIEQGEDIRMLPDDATEPGATATYTDRGGDDKTAVFGAYSSPIGADYAPSVQNDLPAESFLPPGSAAARMALDGLTAWHELALTTQASWEMLDVAARAV